MMVGSQTRFIVIHKTASSLYSLIADGNYRATALSRNTWKSLIGSQASLQPNCNKEGFNAVSGNYPHSRARIGIIANQENDCGTCDSRIGFGTGGKHDNSNTCGNEATYSPDNGDKHIKAMGYIFVQWRWCAYFSSFFLLKLKTRKKHVVQWLWNKSGSGAKWVSRVE